MENKFLTIFLGVIISLFFVNHCSAALPSPEALDVKSVGAGSAILVWDYDSSKISGVKQFKLLWRDSATDTWYAVYPNVGSSTSTFEYVLRGLPTGGSTYEWRLKAESTNPALDSGYADGPTFETTIPEEEPDPDPDPDPNGGGIIPTITSPFENIGNVQEAADAFMEFLALTGFAIGPILIIYAAFLLLTKQGNPAAIAQAQKIILWTIISLSIILFAKGIPSVVKDLFK